MNQPELEIVPVGSNLSTDASCEKIPGPSPEGIRGMPPQKGKAESEIFLGLPCP